MALRADARILNGNAVDDRGNIARKIDKAHPIDAVAGAAIVNHRFPLRKSRGRRFRGGAGFRVRTKPAGPFLAGIIGVTAADEEFDAGIIRASSA